MTILTTIQNELSKYVTLTYIPEQYRWLVPFGLIVFGLLMLFKSKDTWRFAIGMIGAFGAYFEVMNLINTYGFSLTLFGTTLPSFLLAGIAAALGMILLYFIVEFAILAALGYVTYYVMSTHFNFSLSISVVAAILAFGVSFVLYQKIATLLAKVIGTVILFVGLIMFAIPTTYAVAIAVVVLIVSLVLTVYKKKISALYQQHKAKDRIEDQKTQKRWGRKPKGGEKGMGIISKVTGTAKKLIPHRHKSEVVEETTVESETTTTLSGGVIVHKDGTTEKVK